MRLKTIIIDDEPDALDKLQSYAKRIPFLELVAKCNGTSEALEYMSDHDVDLIFTDIEMPDVNGVSFIESLTQRTMVVFITAYPEYALDGFRLSAVDYIVKPYSLPDFQRAANKALEVYQSRHPHQPMRTENDSIFVKTETRFERFFLRDIRYIKGYGEYLQLYIKDRPRPVLTISSFAAIMDRLSPEFIQVHRSYIVNVNHIEKVERSRVIMDADTYIPVGNIYRDDFFRYLLSHAVGKVASVKFPKQS